MFFPFSRFKMTLVLIFIASPLFAGDGEVKIKVFLSPAGSFTAKSAELETKKSTSRSGGAFKAGQIELNLNTLKTGISLRDTHMRDRYFETSKYPKAILRDVLGKDGKWKGTLVIRETAKPISGTYETEGNQLIATFRTKMSDFKIPPARYMGVGAKDEVEVEARLPF
jgi:hypothetical protein